ncbi:serine/threonine protein kinase [Sandaracinus amylolyticus]|uniref:serine/threonine protein kinase n=1 Tax=Sandaracinus amylolyticus TaxID=927083 RepID=UPI001F282461|nr:serine/threonine-protein kinase [Sandaracinus amylolyticus]UJR86480.1 Hypothetical protein I5071_85750 [Sandaracinus amylolyticus]
MKLCTACGTRFSEPVAFCPHDGTPTQELNDAPPPDPLLGRVIDGRYRVEKAIGEGGMGVVYLISHVVLGKRMALKVLRGDMAKDGDVVQRFMQEAQSATSIGHPNIIDISDFGRLPDGSVYFVMEFLDGTSLTHFIGTGGSIPMQTALHVIRQIASALDAAHARGIVHRDMKPDNVYLVKQGKDPHFVKVLDFGIAKVGGASSKLTKTGMIFGTPHYMSPEQASGQSVDRRTDVYALGVIMYEMFTGKVPFDGDTFMGILSKHMFEQPLPPSQVQGTKGLGAVEDVILKSLAKKPEDRYQSMSELIDDLDKIAGGGQLAIGRRGGIAPPGNLADALEPPTRTEMRLGQAFGADGMPPPEPDVVPKSRAPMIALAIVVLLFVGVGVGGVVFWASGSAATAGATSGPAPIVVPPLPPGTSTTPTPTTTPPAVTTTTPVTTTPPSTPQTPVVAPRARVVQITSEPIGAEVVIDGAIVGNTPLELPAPESGDRVAEVRMRGYESASVMIGATSPETVRVTLTPARVASGGGGRRPPRETTTTTEAPTPTPTPTPRTRPQSEVVDPWAQ